jgi:hypothetical protein
MSVTRVVAIAVYALAGVLVTIVELLGRREGSRVPTFGAICGFVMQYRAGRLPVGRIAIYGFWWWVGWHFFAR